MPKTPKLPKDVFELTLPNGSVITELKTSREVYQKIWQYARDCIPELKCKVTNLNSKNSSEFTLYSTVNVETGTVGQKLLEISTKKKKKIKPLSNDHKILTDPGQRGGRNKQTNDLIASDYLIKRGRYTFDLTAKANEFINNLSKSTISELYFNPNDAAFVISIIEGLYKDDIWYIRRDMTTVKLWKDCGLIEVSAKVLAGASIKDLQEGGEFTEKGELFIKNNILKIMLNLKRVLKRNYTLNKIPVEDFSKSLSKFIQEKDIPTIVSKLPTAYAEKIAHFKQLEKETEISKCKDPQQQ